MNPETRPDLMQRLVRRTGRFAPLLVVVALILLGVAGPSTVTYSNTPDFCASCHSMEDEYAVWKESPHAEAAACIDCHSDPGALGELSAHIKGVRMLYMTIAKITPTLVMDHEIPNDYCEKCHKMVDEKAGGVRVNHEKHLSQGGRCQDCHAGLTHKRENETKPVNERFHSICMDCHQSRQVVLKGSGTTSCTACHSVLDKVMPSDHDGEWLGKHGKSAATQNCGECHMAGSAGPHGLMSNSAAFAAPEVKDRCAACHKTEMPHPESYLRQHGTDARSQGAAVCANCHSPQTPAVPKPDHASEKFCSACHSGVAMPHPANWLEQHGPAAGRSDNPVCLVCHSSANRVNPSARYAANDFCVSCHTGLQMPHPEKFMATHGQQALQSGISCKTCHSVLNPVASEAPHASEEFCSTCHSGVTMPHPANWLAQHGPAAGRSDNPVCLVCHSSANQVRPSASYAANDFCLSCHAGLEMPHTQQFTASHGQQALASGISCQTCHSMFNPVAPQAPHASATYCTACHSESRHEAGWVAAHGEQVKPVCFTCHSQEKGGRNSCQECHQGDPGQKQLFHPDPYWFVSHRSAAKEQGEAACLRCHAEVQPSCSKCHRNR